MSSQDGLTEIKLWRCPGCGAYSSGFAQGRHNDTPGAPCIGGEREPVTALVPDEGLVVVGLEKDEAEHIPSLVANVGCLCAKCHRIEKKVGTALGRADG